ncbi:MAG TPA: SagB/ThcOx family dehydrogenase [Candidatus Dormibacteraeota bacterium]|nr:SagB/ThcOx family dehydrogenase [Candidatus Dormibacteraeota bacterium]
MAHLHKFLLTVFLTLMWPGLALRAAEAPVAIELPPARTSGGKPLMDALKERRTTREFSSEKLTPQTMSDLLWAAFGVNRSSTGQRTAPSAMNSQEIEIYVALPEGLFIYDAKAHRLTPAVIADLRRQAGGQASFASAPVTLIYVANLPKLTKASTETRPFYAGFDAGCVCQNVYLYCASAGLATVVHDLDRPRLSEAMRLKPEQQIILAQAVGFPSVAK